MTINEVNNNVTTTRLLLNGNLVNIAIDPPTLLTLKMPDHGKLHIVNVGGACRCDIYENKSTIRTTLALRFGCVGMVENFRTRDSDERESDDNATTLKIVVSEINSAMNRTESDFKQEVNHRLLSSAEDETVRGSSSKGGASSIAEIARSCKTRTPPFLHACKMIASMAEVNAFKNAAGEQLCVAARTLRHHHQHQLIEKANSTTTTTTTTTTTQLHLFPKKMEFNNQPSHRIWRSSATPPRIEGILEIAAISKRAASGEAMWRQSAASFSTMMRHLQKTPGAFCWHADEQRRTIIAKSIATVSSAGSSELALA
jgi:hypothetical protein